MPAPTRSPSEAEGYRFDSCRAYCRKSFVVSMFHRRRAVGNHNSRTASGLRVVQIHGLTVQLSGLRLIDGSDMEG